MGKPAARVGDMHVCPMVTPGVPPIPHVGGPIMGPGVPTVLIGKMPAAVLTDMCTCVGPPANIVLGSMGVFIGKKPAARMGDMTAHGGTITIGCPTVLIGESCAGGGSSGGASAGMDAGAMQKGIGDQDAMDAALSRDMVKLSGQALAAVEKTTLTAGVKNRLKSEILTLTGHPVNVADGSVMTSVTDFAIHGPIPFVWKRSWFSNALYQGPLGHGWFHPYDMAMEIQADINAIVVRLDEGVLAVFNIPEPGEFFFNRKEKMTLYNDGEFFYLKDQIQQTYRFSREGTGQQFAWVHLLESIENTQGFSLRFEYETNGQLSSILDSAGREFIFKKDNAGRILSIKGPSPWDVNEKINLASYAYDSDGNLRQSTDALGNTFHYEYSGHLLTKETNRIGLSFYFDYEGTDEKAKCLRTFGDGGIYDHKLKYFTGHIEVTNSRGDTTIYQHMNGLVVRTTDPLGGVKWSMYNEFNEITVLINENEIDTTFGYDDEGNQVLVIFADGTKIITSYNDQNRPVEVIDQLGSTWKYRYDEEGRGLLVEQEDPLGSKTAYKYTNGLLSGIIDALGAKSTLNYDDYFNLISLTTPTGNTSTWKYDKLSRCTEAIDAKGNKRIMVYDLLGRPTFIEEPDGSSKSLEYDAEGNMVNAADKDYKVGFEYTGMNKMKARIQGGTRIEFRYDKEEQLTAIVNEQQLAYRFELNANGQVVSESSLDGLKKNYTRDAAGKIIKVERLSNDDSKENKEIIYTHDLLGRLTEITYHDGSKENFVYRADGALVEAINQHQTSKLERDVIGRIIKDIQGNVEVSSTYDVLNNRIKVASSLGAQFNYLRDVMGEVAEVNGKNDLQVKFNRDQFGLETERAFTGGLLSRWNRDRLGRPEQQETYTGAVINRTRNYTWETNSRLSKITDSKSGAIKFEHDQFGNLVSAQKGVEDPIYRIQDIVGNLFRTKEGKDRKYGASGQLLEAGSKRYAYDEEGNLIERKEADGRTWKYFWTASGILESVERPEGTRITYTYDALGRRLSKTYLGNTTRWVWDGNTPLHEWVENNQLINESIKAAATSGESRGSEAEEKFKETFTTWLFEPDSFAPLAKVKQGKTFGIITDHLGTPLSMHATEGHTVWQAELNCYGQVSDVIGKKEDCPFRFPGQYEDAETGLYYNRFRYYAPEEGMYISQDPIGLLGGISLSKYVNDPITQIDPLGLCPRIDSARARQAQMLKDNVAYNVSPTKWDSYPTIGRNGTFVTDKQGAFSGLGNVDGKTEITITKATAAAIEKDSGLEAKSLQSGFKIRKVSNIISQNPQSPMAGNDYFLGQGRHLPGGAPEIVIDSIPTKDNTVVQTILKVNVV